MHSPTFIVIDLFCGFGGTDRGFRQARAWRRGKWRYIAKTIACVNHDPKAIASHSLNNPDVVHFTEDMRTLNLDELTKIVEKYRKLYPNAYLILWASLECTNYSKAKGGMSRNQDSRTLANHLFRYIEAVNPDYIQIENVVEFMSWGPMRIKCKKQLPDRSELKMVFNKKTKQLEYHMMPISKKKGQDWLEWKLKICTKYGYYDEWREMTAANFCAYTNRNRLFGCFAKHGLPISWPVPTHAKPEKTSKKKKKQEQTLLSLFDAAPAPLEPWKPVKEVLDFSDEGESIFNRTTNMNLRKQDRHDLAEASLARIYEGAIKHVAGGRKNFTEMQSFFLAKYYGAKKGQHSSVEEPAGTIPVKDRFALTTVRWLDKQYSGIHNHASVDDIAGVIMNNDKHCLMNAERGKWIQGTNFTNTGSAIHDPHPVITANGKWHYLMNPQYFNVGSSVNDPCFTLIAKMDKRPPYLVALETGEVVIEVYETDSPYTRKLKELMAMFGIVDIKMRMLRIPELLQIQGFPVDHKMVGSQADRKKFIGNSVVPIVVQRWAEAMDQAIHALPKHKRIRSNSSHSLILSNEPQTILHH